MTIPAYVDMARLCQELCLSERTVEDYVAQGILPAPRRPGGPHGKRLWKWKEVDRCLDALGNTAPPSADAEAERIRNATRELLKAERA